MSQGMRRPILVGGLGLTAGAMVLGWMSPTVAHLSEGLLWTSILLGGGWLWWKRPARSLTLPSIPQPLDRAGVERSLKTAETWLAQWRAEQPTPDAPEATPEPWAPYQAQLEDLRHSLNRDHVAIALLGSAGSGKTHLLQHLNQWCTQSPHGQQVQGLAEIEGDWLTLGDRPIPALHNADLVIVLITGDLTDSERAGLERLRQEHHRLVLAFSKQDHYLPDERPLILQQVRERASGLVPLQDVVAVAPHPSPIKVRQHQADGTVQERMEQPAPMLADLTARLDAALAVEVPTLVLATTQRQAEALTTAIRGEVNQLRRDRAMAPIEQAQWIAATAAFASPVPSLDLLATASVNAQLVMDLGALYHQKMSVDQAKQIASTLADTMIKLGLVELTSQALAPLLKSHALTFAVGGLMQGLSAAYLTRMAGLSLVEYFQAQDLCSEPGFRFQPEQLSQILQRVFQANQRTAFLQALVNQGMQRLKVAVPGAIATP